MKLAKLTTVLLTITLCSFCNIVCATATPAELTEIRGLIQQMIDVNNSYIRKFTKKVSTDSLKNQTPNTTAVLCSDSRVDTEAINDDPVGNLFVIRNIGNQVDTAYGSVEYGVYHLHTNILLVVGHSQCGAIKAAMSDYSAESKRIRAELDSLEVDKSISLNANIVHNINHQVSLAVDDFEDKVNSGEVVIIGLVYDLHNDYKMGSGQLIIVNINNETDPKILATSKYLTGLNNVKLLQQSDYKSL
jgi:carbonic anhydrase